jgi:hypothetical protein
MEICLINRSLLFDKNAFIPIIDAINQTLTLFCKDWGIPNHTVIYNDDFSEVMEEAYNIYVYDSIGSSNMIGYHSYKNNIISAVISIKKILKHGGTFLFDEANSFVSVSQMISHEIFEMIINQKCDKWKLFDENTKYQLEVCDAVQRNVIQVKIGDKIVGISDWVLPSWFDKNSKKPYNHLNTLSKPFEIDNGGYIVCSTNGINKAIFDKNVDDDIIKSVNAHIRF